MIYNIYAITCISLIKLFTQIKIINNNNLNKIKFYLG